MRVIPAAVTIGAVAAAGIWWLGYTPSTQTQSVDRASANDRVACDIVYADGSDYVDEMGSSTLEAAPKEIRRVSPSNWIVVLFVKPLSTKQKDLRTGEVFERATHTPKGRPFTGLPIVTDAIETRDAMHWCITGMGSPS